MTLKPIICQLVPESSASTRYFDHFKNLPYKSKNVNSWNKFSVFNTVYCKNMSLDFEYQTLSSRIIPTKDGSRWSICISPTFAKTNTCCRKWSKAPRCLACPLTSLSAQVPNFLKIYGTRVTRLNIFPNEK